MLIFEKFLAKVTVIEESKDLDEIKIQELKVLFKPMSYLYHLKGRANHLLSRQSMRD